MKFTNKHRQKLFLSVCGATLGLLSQPLAHGADSWTMSLVPQVLLTQYSGSTQRDNLAGYGVFLKADYLDKGGLAAGYNFSTAQGQAGYPDIEETTLYLSGRHIRYSDLVAGKLGFRLDGYAIRDETKFRQSTGGDTRRDRNDTVTEVFSDDIGALYAQVDYTNYSERFYADFGYAHSNYAYEENVPPYSDNTVQQFSTAAALALNNRYDWLQSRFYFINLEHSDNTAGVKQTSALEFKWLHWFKPKAPLKLHSMLLKAVAGKRLFAVDPDAAAVYTVADIQTSSVAGGVDWKFGEQNKFFLLLGYDRYEDPRLGEQYGAGYLFGNLSITW